MKYFIVWLVLLSVIAFILYGVDKHRAKRGKWRIRESVLLWLGFLGGACGALLGMQTLRHKTKHFYFYLVNLLGLAWQIALLIYLL